MRVIPIPQLFVISRDGRIVGEGVSAVITNADPTAHAERQAIRDAQRRLGGGWLTILNGLALAFSSYQLIVAAFHPQRQPAARRLQPDRGNHRRRSRHRQSGDFDELVDKVVEATRKIKWRIDKPERHHEISDLCLAIFVLMEQVRDENRQMRAAHADMQRRILDV